MTPFCKLAEKYDVFNANDTALYTEFIKDCFLKSDIPVKEVLDVGCGTGVITIPLANAGYDMVGVDISAEMLFELKKKNGSENVLVLMQDMRSLDLYGTVQGAVCTYDCLNYLGDTFDLRSALSSVSLFMEKGGVFVFDINTKYTYENVYADNSYVYEKNGDMLVWQNFYNKKTKKCYFDLTLFEKTKNGYERFDETQLQRYFPIKTVEKILTECGFEVICKYGSPNKEPLLDNSPKAYFVCKKRR